MDGKTIPIKTVGDLISHYERRAQRIADNFEERARWGHRQHDAYELAMVKEFLNLLYGLDEKEEIRRMKQASDLAWMRVRKYVEHAMDEIVRHCPEDPEEDLEEGEDYEECD